MTTEKQEVLVIEEGGTYSGSDITAVFGLEEEEKAIKILKDKVAQYNQNQEIETNKLEKKEGGKLPTYIENGRNWGTFISLDKSSLQIGDLNED